MPEDPVAGPGQLETVSLTRVHFELNREFDFDFDNVAYNLAYHSEVGLLDPDGLSLVDLAVEINWSVPEGRAHPFDLAVTVTGGFVWEDPSVDEAWLRGWLKFNGTYLLWPYARQHVSTLTLASMMPPLFLETLTVPRPSMGHETGEIEVVSDPPAG